MQLTVWTASKDGNHGSHWYLQLLLPLCCCRSAAKGTLRQRWGLRGAKGCNLSLDLAKTPGGRKINLWLRPLLFPQDQTGASQYSSSKTKTNTKTLSQDPGVQRMDPEAAQGGRRQTDGVQHGHLLGSLFLVFGTSNSLSVCTDLILHWINQGNKEVASWKEFAYDLKRSSRQTHGQALS